MKKFFRSILIRLGFIADVSEKTFETSIRKMSAKTVSRRNSFLSGFFTRMKMVLIVAFQERIILIQISDSRVVSPGVSQKGSTVTTIGVSSAGIVSVLADTLEGVIRAKEARDIDIEMEQQINSREAEDFLKNVTKSINGGPSGNA